MSDDSAQPAVRVCLTRCPLSEPEQGVHSLPCHIQHNGPAAIKSYFRPQEVRKEDNATDTEWRAEFRGVQLRGTRVVLKDMEMQGTWAECVARAWSQMRLIIQWFAGTVGLVMEDAGLTHTADEGRIWEVDNHFEEMMCW
jgi:photosystem II stability/assembly factor-like uncharacterized protein